MEKLMQYVWNYRLWNHLVPMKTVDGQTVRVIDNGRINHDSGPDFFNAKVCIDGETWAGNVEIHVKASDWFRHHHDQDPAYDSVILHVVQVDDAEIRRSNGQPIPQMVLQCDPNIGQYFNALTGNRIDRLPCGSIIHEIPSVYITNWLHRMGIERLMAKTERIRTLLRQTSGDHDQVAYATIARALGTSINGESFQGLAMSTPLNLLYRCSDIPLTIEAILFGQARMLDSDIRDMYYESLQREYRFQQHKNGLRPSEAVNWKMSRMRPPALPHRRIALLARLIGERRATAEALLGIRDADDARRVFEVPLSEYWQTHYTFSPTQQTMMPHSLGTATLNMLIINAVVPFQYATGISSRRNDLAERAVDMLSTIPRENNRIVNTFTDCGIDCPDAFTSQALIQLNNEYCNARKCMYCTIGYRWLASKATRPQPASVTGV